MPSILLFGATGLVGSHLVLALRDRYPKLPVTVYVRNTSIDNYFTSTAGVARVVHGDFSEHAKIQALAEEHDIVINVGSSGDLGFTEAIMEGLKKKPAESKPVLIHMSGTGNFLEMRWDDGSHHSESKVWSDDSVEDMKAINLDMYEGGPAALILKLNETHPHIVTYIVFPSAMFGASAGPIHALGVIQRLMYLKAKELGFVPCIGDGTAIVNLVHIDAVIAFIPKIIDLSMESSAPQGSQYERTFFIGGPDITWKEVATIFAKAFHAKGIVSSPDCRSVSLADAGGPGVQGVMSRDMCFISPRAERLGYKYDQPDLPEYVRRGGEMSLPDGQ